MDRLPGDNKAIIARLSYWELLALKKIAPLYYDFDRDNLTDQQKMERDAFIREGERGPWSGEQLQLFEGFTPMPRRID